MKATALLMAAGALAAPFLELETDLQTRQDIANLDALFKDKGKLYFGTCSDQALLGDEQNSGVIQSTFGQLTPENSMKWDQLNPEEGTYSWDAADALVDYATENNLSIRGHTLVWHSQLAEWVNGVTDPAELTAVIEEHVATVVGRWKGKIRAWDVVNEMFEEDGSLRQSVFSDVLGEDFVRIAFEAARQADPDAILYINDYNLDDPTYAKTTTGMAEHVSKWIADGVPIDGIGSQGHLKPGMGAAHVEALKVLADTGVKEVATTELDIESAPEEDYVAVVQGCLEIETCVGVTVWGVRDPDSWRAESSPLLFDESYSPKPAFDAIAQALQG